MKIKINIDTANAAFADGNVCAESARILRNIADQLDGHEKLPRAGTRHLIRDINGNGVDSCDIKKTLANKYILQKAARDFLERQTVTNRYALRKALEGCK